MMSSELSHTSTGEATGELRCTDDRSRVDQFIACDLKQKRG